MDVTDSALSLGWRIEVNGLICTNAKQVLGGYVNLCKIKGVLHCVSWEIHLGTPVLGLVPGPPETCLSVVSWREG